ncbi:serine hydrolase domain-containing protein [Xanthomonas hortorum]|uniref:Serine hydrolase n=1 Tax=Xanthomonas hortorum TaxID=56454 RepID=A0AA47IBS1_9XANT|nr:serine hydrolase [Xanthomonas hortorum]WAH64694.1 serine hydrolase [Xanthomonas hortorum]
MTRLSLLLSALLVVSPLHAAPPGASAKAASPRAATPGAATPTADSPPTATSPAVPAATTTPPALDDGWPVASTAAGGWNLPVLAQMEQALAADLAPFTTSVLIVRDGVMVYEHYLGDADHQTLHDTRSLTKSVTGLLVGAAIERKLIPNAQAKVYDYFGDRQWQHPDPRKRDITIEDLLTMSSQLECNDDNAFSAGNEKRMYVSADWTQFALDLPIRGYAPWMQRPAQSPHGRAFSYCTAGSFLLGAVLEKASGQRLQAFSAQVLEKPLGIEQAQWNVSSEGVGMGGGGTRYRSRDLAKFGQLLLAQGCWQGRQVIAANWIGAMTSVHAQARDDADYGYQLWHFLFPVHGVQRDTWAMSGNGGNYVFVVPAERLVVVLTRSAYNTRQMHQQSHRLLTDYVLKALPEGNQAR